MNSRMIQSKRLSIFAGLGVCATLLLSTSAVKADSVQSAAASGNIAQLGGPGWSFGTFTTSNSANDTFDPTTFARFTTFDGTNVGGLNNPNLEEWYNAASGTDPNVIFNKGTSDVDTTPQFGDILLQAGTVNLGPYLGPTVVQYTAPADGFYDITSTFQTVQKVANSAPFASVYKEGKLLYGEQLPGNSPNSFFGGLYSDGSTGVFLGMGKSVDFVVWGANSDNKTTQLSASVTPSGLGTNPVPLPPSAKLGFAMLASVGIVVSIRRRFARKLEIA